MAKKLTKSQLTTKKREDVLAMLAEILTDLDEEVMRESGNALVYPSVDDDGNEFVGGGCRSAGRHVFLQRRSGGGETKH